MNALHNEKRYQLASQLIRIAGIEGGVIDSITVLVIGDTETAKAISELIGCNIFEKISEIKMFKEKVCYNTVFLFEDISDSLLTEITYEGALVIDASYESLGDTVYYADGKKYRRIKVVSLFENKI